MDCKIVVNIVYIDQYSNPHAPKPLATIADILNIILVSVTMVRLWTRRRNLIQEFNIHAPDTH